jgi:hypothetical protein
MSKLNIVLDLDSQSPSFNFQLEDDNSPLSLEISYGARKNGDYENLSFGYSIEENENVVTEVIRPESNVTYIRSDQDFIDFHKIEYSQEVKEDEVFNYQLNAWCEESGNRYEDSYSFQIIIPGIIDPYPDGEDATPDSVGKEYLLDQ